MNTFAENSRLYSPAMARLTPLMTMVETGLLVLELSVSCDSPALPPAYCRRRASVPPHPIKENLPGWSFCPLQVAQPTDLDIPPRRDAEIRSEGKWP